MPKAKYDFKIAAAILAGGQATRLNGLVKGNIKLKNGTTIIQHLINELSKVVFSEIIIVANDKMPYVSYGVEVIADLHKGLGPIAGIEAALTHYLNRFNTTLFLPSDLPAITALEIEQLKDFYLRSHAPVVYAKTKIAHPLCAIVDNALVDEISELIKAGERKISNIWESLGAETVNFEHEQSFTNINTWTDKEILNSKF